MKALSPERQGLMCKYIDSIHASKLSFQTRGKYIDGVYFFLLNAEEITRRGYRKFQKAFAHEQAYMPWMNDAVLDFLAANGIGFRKVKGELYKGSHKRMVDNVEKRDVRQMEIVNNFLTWLKSEREYSQSTLLIYSFTIRDYYSFFDDFTQDNCRKYIAKMEQDGKSPKTIRIRITCLERLSIYLKKPIKLRRPKIKPTLSVDNIPTEKEYQKLLDYADQNNTRFAFIIRLLGTTGCRVSELVQFTYEMVQDGNTILKGKGSKYRQFFFTKLLQEQAKGKSGYVCINKYGLQMTTRGVAASLKSIGEKAGIPKEKMHPHAFRHFFAKMYLKKTKDVVGLADLLGHGSVDTTRIYLQKSKDEQLQSFNRTITW